MAAGKSIKKNFYLDSDSGQTDIEMPPLSEQPPISTAAPDPWATPQQNATAPVPDKIPQEVLEEVNRTQTVYNSDSDESSQTEEEVFDPENDPQVQREVHDAIEAKRSGTTAENMRRLREAREKAERERDELLRLMQMQQMQQQIPKQQPPEEDDLNIEDDALVEGKTLRKMHKDMKELKKQLQSYQYQSQESITEAKIKAAYPDFDKVVSQENIDAFREQYPELAQTLHSTADLYSKAVSAYTLIKQFGIHKDPVINNDHARAIKNVNKPRPLASVNPQQGDSPLSKANAFANGEFTEEMKEQLRKEMFRARRDY